MNDDALPYPEHEGLFDLFRQLFGLSLKGTHSQNEAGIDVYTLLREADVEISGRPSVIECPLHTMDQLMMGYIAQRYMGKELEALTIKTDSVLTRSERRDYHVDAMIKVARYMGITVRDSKPTQESFLVHWLENATSRTVTLS